MKGVHKPPPPHTHTKSSHATSSICTQLPQIKNHKVDKNPSILILVLFPKLSYSNLNVYKLLHTRSRTNAPWSCNPFALETESRPTAEFAFRWACVQLVLTSPPDVQSVQRAVKRSAGDNLKYLTIPYRADKTWACNEKRGLTKGLYTTSSFADINVKNLTV